ncbi:MAG: PD40 domain-containing protein [Planctomycetaceae bacterium]|nr:PD40 domain-containing protein [Planctomycetaceae bacterium]
MMKLRGNRAAELPSMAARRGIGSLEFVREAGMIAGLALVLIQAYSAWSDHQFTGAPNAEQAAEADNHSQPIYRVFATPTEDCWVLQTNLKAIRRNTESGKEVERLDFPGLGMTALSFDRQGERAIAISFQQELLVFGRETVDSLGAFPPEQVVLDVAMAPTGDWASSLHLKGLVRIHSTRDLKTVRQFKTIAQPVVHAFSPDGERLALGGENGDVGLFHRDGRLIFAARAMSCSRVGTIAWSPDGRQLAFGDGEGRVELFNATTGVRLASRQAVDLMVPAIAFSSDGKRLAVGSFDKNIHILDAENLVEVDRLEGHRSLVRCLTVLPSGDLVSGGLDGKTIRWRRAEWAAPVREIVQTVSL